MCIGMPMQVRAFDGAWAECEGRGETRRVNTVLVGDVAPGEWVLVFLNDARERIDAQRAAEVNTALDLVLQAMQGQGASEDVDFLLPSQMGLEQVAQLTGQPPKP